MKTTDNFHLQKTCTSCLHIGFIDGVYLCLESKPDIPDKFIGYGQVRLKFEDLVVHPQGICSRYQRIPQPS